VIDRPRFGRSKLTSKREDIDYL